MLRQLREQCNFILPVMHCGNVHVVPIRARRHFRVDRCDAVLAQAKMRVAIFPRNCRWKLPLVFRTRDRPSQSCSRNVWKGFAFGPQRDRFRTVSHRTF